MTQRIDEADTAIFYPAPMLPPDAARDPFAAISQHLAGWLVMAIIGLLIQEAVAGMAAEDAWENEGGAVLP